METKDLPTNIEPATETYEDLPLTKFPVEEDTYGRMMDVSVTLMPLVQQYNAYFASGDYGKASQIIEANPDLLDCFFNADKWNKLRDAILAIERYYLEDVQTFLYNVAQNALGINDNPTPAQILTTTYSANKINVLLSDINQHLSNVEASFNRSQSTVTVTLPLSGWSTTVPYTIRVAVPGIKSTDNPELKVYAPKTLDVATVKLRQKMTGMITDGMTENGYVTFYCGAKRPTSDFVVLLKGVNSNG